MSSRAKAPPKRTAPKRRYDTTRRDRQAAATRQEVLEAAVELFRDSGWAGTTLAAIAERAGVAIETIYNGFGSKKGLLRAACDVAVVGDTQEVPLAERPEYQRMGEGSLEARLHAAITLNTDVLERSALLWRAVVEAAVADSEAAEWRDEFEAGRYVDTRRGLTLVFGAPPDPATADLLWAVLGPEVYLKLVHERGQTRAEYETLMVRAVRDLGS
ncbi:MAG: helix-turn-helix domain-containing protein [Acidimicrobiia bacterium]